MPAVGWAAADCCRRTSAGRRRSANQPAAVRVRNREQRRRRLLRRRRLSRGTVACGGGRCVACGGPCAGGCSIERLRRRRRRCSGPCRCRPRPAAQELERSPACRVRLRRSQPQDEDPQRSPARRRPSARAPPASAGRFLASRSHGTEPVPDLGARAASYPRRHRWWLAAVRGSGLQTRIVKRFGGGGTRGWRSLAAGLRPLGDPHGLPSRGHARSASASRASRADSSLAARARIGLARRGRCAFRPRLADARPRRAFGPPRPAGRSSSAFLPLGLDTQTVGLALAFELRGLGFRAASGLLHARFSCAASASRCLLTPSSRSSLQLRGLEPHAASGLRFAPALDAPRARPRASRARASVSRFRRAASSSRARAIGIGLPPLDLLRFELQRVERGAAAAVALRQPLEHREGTELIARTEALPASSMAFRVLCLQASALRAASRSAIGFGNLSLSDRPPADSVASSANARWTASLAASDANPPAR